MGQLNDEIDRVAAEWAAKLAGGDLSPGECERLAAWQAADIRHAGAFARAQAILARLGRLQAVGADALRKSIEDAANPPSVEVGLEIHSSPEEPDVAYEDAAVPRVSWSRRRALAVGGTGLLAAAGLTGVIVRALQPQNVFSTAKGETRSVGLPDGSVVTLNTDSRVSVAFTEEKRTVRLERGEAIFKVAKNKHRPFIVAAFNTEVRAVGTAFTVRLLPKRPVEILVQEGVVEIVRRDAPARPVRAVAETRTVVAPATPIVVQALPRPQVARRLAWQYGRIALENETLGDAAEEFARYSDTKIVVDSSVAGRTVTGLFAADDPVGFAKVVASVLDLQIEEGPKEVRIYR